jgi:signal transduction histidine kinase
LNVVLANVVETFRPQFHSHQIKFNFIPSRNPLVFEFDQGRIKQVMMNLIDNALKYTPAGGMITVEAKEVGDTAQIIVKDNGDGIPAEALPNLFDRFYQVNNKNRKTHRGAGLGLCVVDMLVRAHGGKVWANSQLGEGTQIYYTLALE